MPLGKLQVERTARPARLELSPKETDGFTQKLTAMVEYLDRLIAVEVISMLLVRLRPDKTQPSLVQKQTLGGALVSGGGYFPVSKVSG
jgi:aspartyl/glutamyl-tRNA(Asn/Gln) amidotransferase C subunit